jgi:serine/threonine protein kinase
METQTWRKGDIVGDGRFEILQELGAGGFGITYLAQDHVKKQRIAIKTLNSNQQREKDFAVRQKKFESEGFTLRGFRHPHIVRVYEKVEINGLLGFVMEYISGQDLAKYVRAKGRLSEKESLLYIDQISLALDYVHQDTFLHRDVNPRNIMLREDRREAVLIDFGLAREFAELEPIYLSNTDGSELYKPVEQYEKRGVFGPPTDIYALAVTLYFLLNGAPLGNGKNWIAFTSIARKMNYGGGKGKESDRELWAELINVGVSARTLAAIQAGMAIEPEDRPKNITEFRELLGLLPAATPLPEMPPLSFPELLATSQPLQSLSEQPFVVVPIAANPPPGLTASIPTKANTSQYDFQGWRDRLDQPVVTTSKKESISPGLTASVSPPAKLPEDIKKKEESRRSTVVKGNRSASPQPEKSAPHSNQRSSKKTSLVSRRLILQSLLGTGGLVGFGFVGLLLKNLFEPQPSSKTIIESIPTVQSNTAFSLETIQITTVKLDNQALAIDRPAMAVQIYKEYLGSGVSLTMVKIPAGSFLMGSPSNEEKSESNEKPQHKVTLKSFYLGQTEVTQAQYQAIIE